MFEVKFVLVSHYFHSSCLVLVKCYHLSYHKQQQQRTLQSTVCEATEQCLHVFLLLLLPNTNHVM